MNSDIEKQEKLDFLVASDVTNCLVKMAQTSEIKLGSGNSIRNGYMGFITQLANLIIKVKGTGLDTCTDQETVFLETV